MSVFSSKREGTSIPCCYFPGTSAPVPAVLTPQEAVRFLRLDEAGIKDPLRTLAYYRRKGLLRATLISRCIRYRLPDLLDFLDRAGEVNPR